MNDNNHVSNILDVTVEKMRSVADADTIIGDRIELNEGVVAIPVSKVSYGFASGGSDFRVKSSPNSPLFGGGGGGGMTVTPVGFLVGKGADVRLVPIPLEKEPEAGRRRGCLGGLTNRPIYGILVKPRIPGFGKREISPPVE